MADTGDDLDAIDADDTLAGEDAPDGQPATPSRPRRILAALVRTPSFAGLAIALLFFWESLSPTLMPRTWPVQAAISGLCAASGYGFGLLGSVIARAILRLTTWQPSATLRLRTRQVVTVAAPIVIVVGLLLWRTWQNAQRDLVGMDHLGVGAIVPVLLVTPLLGAIFFAIGRLIGAAARGLDRWNRKHLPKPIAQPATVVLILVLAVFVLRDVAFVRFTDWADATFSVVDTGTNEGTERPTADTVSGSPNSLVRWDDLGIQGREFVADATSAERLRDFHGSDAAVQAPIRVYVGLRSADTARERAALAVRELERTGAFDREVLVVAAATGTGWIDPDAAEAVEMMHRGDTAIVSMQYSYLPSWISFITDLHLARETGAALFDAVHEKWASLPADHRPKLVSFGLSLGSFGAEAAFAGADGHTSVANIVARTDGAMFVGAANANPILQQLTDERDSGSPAWAPVFDGGRVVRFVTRDPKHPLDTKDWPDPRVLYIQHPSDPVTYFGPSWFWREPDWMDDPRGYDVPKDGRWFPFVSGVQGIFDLMAGFAAPPGHGHDYRLDYVAGWAQLQPPKGWSDRDTARLERFLFPDR